MPGPESAPIPNSLAVEVDKFIDVFFWAQQVSFEMIRLHGRHDDIGTGVLTDILDMTVDRDPAYREELRLNLNGRLPADRQLSPEAMLDNRTYSLALHILSIDFVDNYDRQFPT